METNTESLAEELGRNLEQINAARIDALAQAADTRIMLRALLQHEALRVERKLGAEHPRAVQLRMRLQADREHIDALAAERERFEAKVPEVANEGALVHGRVVDEDGRGIRGLRVGLLDRSGLSVAGTDEPITDTSGYFAIVLDPESVERLRTAHEAGVFLALFTVKDRRVHRQPKPLALARGARLVEEIALNRIELVSGGSTAPPPPEVRTVVVPTLTGIPEDAAVKLLKTSGLEPGTRTTRPAPNRVGLVLEQEPAAGAEVAPGSAVSMVIGVADERMVPVPMLIGLALKEARVRLEASDLVLGSVGGPSPSDASIVQQQSPQPESEVPRGTAVDLVVTRRG